MSVEHYQPITVTPQAADWIQSQLRVHADCEGILVGVKPSGCTGFSYVLDFAQQVDPEHIRIQDQGVTLFVHPDHIQALAGTVIQFYRRGLNTGLEFHNPNVTAQCGCGESFSL